ncbi:MAG: MarR family transcriptional regulator [Burkholderiaceae bacterium]|nr:MarR family transcriptional regulator [Burkholderiaceae bacterium]
MELRQDSLSFLLADVSRLMRRAFRQRLQGSALTLAQARVLIYVSIHEGCRQVDLADLLEVQPITLARLIDKLVEAGLVERRPDPADRRAYQLYLTACAAPHLAAIEEVATTIRADALRDLTEQEAAMVILTLKKMRDNFALH